MSTLLKFPHIGSPFVLELILSFCDYFLLFMAPEYKAALLFKTVHSLRSSDRSLLTLPTLKTKAVMRTHRGFMSN